MSEITMIAEIIEQLLAIWHRINAGETVRGSVSARSLIWLLHQDEELRSQLIAEMKADPDLAARVAKVADGASSSVLRSVVAEADKS